MGEAKLLPHLEETPGGVTTSSTWLNLDAAESRDMPSALAQTRERARERIQQAIEKGRERLGLQPEPKDSTGSWGGTGAIVGIVKTTEAAMQIQQSFEVDGGTGVQPLHQPSAQGKWEIVASSAAADNGVTPETSAETGSALPVLTEPAPLREEKTLVPRDPWRPDEELDCPAWLAPDRAALAAANLVIQAPADTLQGARDRMTSRWFALKGVFQSATSVEPEVPASASYAPVLAVFSLAGGVGKTSIVATLGRALSARGERILLVETAAYGLLPFYFGSQDRRSGVLRTFSPPETSSDAPLQMVTIDPDAIDAATAPQDSLPAEIIECTRSVSRVIVDLATASATAVRRVLRMSPMILVPLVPDMNSVVGTSSIETFFQRNNGGAAKPAEIYYILNEFDPSLPLHLDMREVLREQLGYRLLPFALRHAPAVSEALAEGMTVMDYAPDSPLAEDFNSLAAWLKSVSAAALTSRSKRWSER